MNKRQQLQLVLHGSLAIVIAALCGFPYMWAISGEWGEEAVRAWGLAHRGPAVSGIWMIAVAGVHGVLRLSSAQASVCVGSLAISAYTFSISTVLAAHFGVRGLTLQGPPLNLVVYAGYTVGAIASVLGLGCLLLGAIRGLREVP